MAAASPLLSATRHPLLDFCFKRQDEKAVTKIREDNPTGLGDFTVVNESLTQERYIEVLTAVWAEKDNSKKLGWLRSKAGEYHVVLLFEHALAELVQTPTFATVQNICLPLIAIAGVRIAQDITCFKEGPKKGADIPISFVTIYQSAMAAIMEKNGIALFAAPNLETIRALMTKSREIEEKTKANTLPSPRWIASRISGEKADDVEILNIPDTWRATRLAYIKTYVAQSKQSLGSLFG